MARRLSSPLIVCLGLVAMLPPVTALGATIVVNTTSDEYNNNDTCSLREAISSANLDSSISGCAAGSGDDLIILPLGSYVITAPGAGEDGNLDGDFDIDTNITITGAGASSTIIDTTKPDRIFHIYGGAVVSLEGMTIRGGSGVALGGGILVEQSALTLDHVVVEGNSGDFGGGVAAVEAISISVEGSTLRGNSAGSRGGAIYSTLGGGMTLDGSTVSGNSAMDGGGLYSSGTDVQITNGTISVNSVMNVGGGMVVDGAEAWLSHATIADNAASVNGGGVDIRNGGVVAPRNSLFSGNAGGNCGGPGMVSDGYNLSSDMSCHLSSAGDVVGVPAGVDALGDNGGATHTQALLTGSPAIDLVPYGISGCGATFVTDQRSVVRPHEGSGGCDAGAYEYLPNICTTYVSADVNNKKIPSSGNSGWMSSSTVTIADGAPIADVNVLDVFGEHAMISDLEFTLTSPAGTSVTLFNTTCSDQNFDIDFDDAAASAVFPCPPTNGNAYQPVGLLTDFDNEDSTGTWTLDIEDKAPGNTGRLLGWGLEVCTGTVVWVENASQNEGAGAMTFTLNMSQPSSLDVFLDYATVDGTAVAGSDYLATSGTLTIPAGDTSATITVDIIDDSFYEINETFVLDLSNPINAYLLPDDAIGTIVNNDPVPAWACNTYPASDVGTIPAKGNSGEAGFVLNIPDYIVVGDVNVVDLTGSHDRMGDLLFSLSSPAGTSVDLFGPVCGAEADFDLNLDNEALIGDIPCPPTDQGTYQPSGSLADFGGQVAQGDWELLITDLYSGNAGNLSRWGLEVCRLALSIGDATALESVGSMDFTVSMNGLSATDVTVHYTTISGTATAGSDFVATSGVLTIPAGSVSGVISVPIINDADVEGCETFGLVLSNTTGALLEDSQATLSGTGRIEDDDGTGGRDPTLAWTLDGSGSEWFGFAVASGDFNGDGNADVAVGAQAANGGDGRVTLFYGPDLLVSTTLNASLAGENFGHAVGSADVNGDGFDDLVVGAHFYGNGETSEGAAYVFHGSAGGVSTTPNWQYESDQASALFGYSVAGAGDVNGDGYEDVIIGAKNYRNGFEFNEGGAFVFHGSASGLSASPDWSVEGGMFIAWLGTSVASAGDVNGDGFGDVVIGAPGYNFLQGAAFVYHGSAGGLALAPAQGLIGTNPGEQFGNAVAGAGDVNGDGIDDVIIGGMGYSNDQSREGQAYVYHGSATGLSATAGWTSEGDLDYLMHGYAVSGAGDVNGDGYGDVLVGGNYQGFNAGQARLFFGSATGLGAIADWSQTGAEANGGFGGALSAGDVDGDGFAEILLAEPKFGNRDGRVSVYKGTGGGGGGVCP